jgi:hypothetical protein
VQLQVERVDVDTVRVVIGVEDMALIGFTAESVYLRFDADQALTLANELAGAVWDLAVASGG